MCLSSTFTIDIAQSSRLCIALPSAVRASLTLAVDITQGAWTCESLHGAVWVGFSGAFAVDVAESAASYDGAEFVDLEL
jgi:hypothetical protein